ncbi:glycosyltransferase family 4 protein [Priestia megaterium]|uniref:glycosyltransferase family 4 protein n=1 Tax=Priestia megaterium TaxID=1404 RepID=UPI00237805EC|nr:glycosyltransferase family 4 protein [Priestia megaterium]WDM33088.1 glycosyltransferase family 4 protein [Priestia megaterium]
MDSQIKLKILMVHNYYQTPGGEDTVLENEKKLLEDQGHEVILYSRNNLELKRLSMFQKLCLPFTTIFSLKTFKEIKKIIKQRKIDIVHVHNTLTLVSPSVYYAAFSCKVPVVQTVHNFRLLCPAGTFYRENNKGNGGICEECLDTGLKCAIKYKCYRGSFLQTVASVSTLKIHRILGTYKRLNYICLTEFNKEKLLEINKGKKVIFDSKKVFVKPNFGEETLDYVPYKDREKQFVFAGRIDKLKGIQILLEAWKEIKDSKLVICGTGPQEEWCKKYIEENGLTNVKMLGFVSNEQVKKIIGESKALILPTQWYEGFPMTIVESLSVGTPVVGSNIGNVGSVIENGITGFTFQFNSVASLRKVISEMDNYTIFSQVELSNKYTANDNYVRLKNIYTSVIDKN